MNITRENLTELEFQVKIEIVETDYAERVQKTLKKYRQQANVPGFRKGTAPMGLISKMYKGAVMNDEIQNLLSESLYNYIDSEKLDIIGTPLSNIEKTGEVDFENGKEFAFYFDCAMAPEVAPKWEAVSTKLINVKVSAKETEKQIEQICERYGKFETPETVGEGNMVYGKAVELDKNGEEKAEGVSTFINFNMNQVKDDAEVRALFLGKKAQDKVRFAANKAFTPTELQNVLHLDEAASKKFKSEMEFSISGISNIVAHEQNEELFNMVFPGQEIKDAAAFKKAMTKEIEKANNDQCQLIYVNEVREALIAAFDAAMPEAFLKRFILTRSEEKDLTAEKLDAEWAEKYLPSIKWEFIEGAINKQKSLQPSQEDIISYIKGILSTNMPAVDGEDAAEREKTIDEQAKTIAGDRNNMRQIVDKLYNDNLFSYFNEQLKPEVEKLTLKELAERVNG